MAYKPKRSGKKDGAPNARSRRAASRTARGVTRPFESAGAEKSVPAKIGTRSLHEDEVNEAIKPVLSEFSLVLERIKISGPAANRTVEITVDYTEDRTDSLSLDSLAEISGAISQALDKADKHDEFFPYMLEVSSPGATRELTERRHWKRARTRLVAVTQTDGTEYVARLDEITDEGPVLRRKKQT
ncbi:MAG: ribosome maturation factor RimP, partial [Rothia dentocariosa]